MGKMTRKNVLIFITVLFIIIFPLAARRGAEFGGADDRGVQLINEINPGYQLWFNVLWEPPSGEIENLIFALQGGIGGLIVGYKISGSIWPLFF